MRDYDDLDRALLELHHNTQKTIDQLMRIAEARIEKGLSHADIAEKMGITVDEVVDIEKRWARGDYPEIDRLKAYARAVGKKLEIRLV